MPMFAYHLRTAILSLRRSPILTTLLIAGVAIGICVSTAFVTLRHMYTQDPLPGKSAQVHYVRLDSWGRDAAFTGGAETFGAAPIPDQVTYRDARALRTSPVPTRQTATVITRLFVYPGNRNVRPFQPDVRLVSTDFFDMFAAPFQYGGPWAKEADSTPERVAVIDDATNTTVFGGQNSVGQTIRMGEHDFRIVGVLAPWRPAIRLFDLTRNATGAPEPIYIPFNLIEPLRLEPFGNNSGWGGARVRTLDELLVSERIWIQYWVELPDAQRRSAYEDWLRSYITDQKKLGRFQRPLYFRLSTIPDLIDEWHLMPAGVKAMSVVSLLFLVVCSLNLVGILLGKFLSRVPEVSVRRALGASRSDIFWQHVIECEVIGVMGGIAGVMLSSGVLALLARYMDNGTALRLDGEMLALASLLSIGAGLVAGVYPAWRICSIPPAMQLKVQ